MDRLTIQIRGFSSHPIEQDLTEAAVFTIPVGGSIDFDALVDGVLAHLRGVSHRFEQNYSGQAWGAAGASGELIIDISSAVGGVAGAAQFVRGWLKDRGKLRTRTTPGPNPGEDARAFAAQMLHQAAETIQVTEVQPIAEGHRVVLETQEGNWVVVVSRDWEMSIKRSKRQ
jgi:hypothetical protein